MSKDHEIADVCSRVREFVKTCLRSMATPDLSECLSRAREHYRTFWGPHLPPLENILETVRRQLEADVRERVRRIRDPYLLSRTRQRWYDETAIQGIHWPALAEYLRREKGWDDEAVDSISASSVRVVSELGDPSAEEFDVRGLVVGYVQSGKTANMTAVIARAVDAGYNLVVVLAGLTDKLRHQTQRRLESDLIARNQHNWYPLTRGNTYDEDGRLLESGDYVGPAGRQLPRVARGVTMIAVIKKHRAQLERLAGDIRNTVSLIRNQFRMLVIDDEADQASPNAGQTGEDPTVTNRKIRELLKTLPAVSYVGYTATPFANVLINPFPPEVGPESESEDMLEDLYPRDFIISLPKPEKYFGPEEIFGRDSADEDDPGADGLPIIRDIPADEIRVLGALNEHAARIADVPELRKAIRWFLLTVAARMARGQRDAHATMLLHTSHRIADHGDLEALVRPELEHLKSNIRESGLHSELADLWDEEGGKVNPGIFGNRPLSSNEIVPHLPEAAERLSLAVENSQSERRLDYEGPPSAIIAIGGNILSRGLTLEGLSVTWFQRQPRQYDTLLQMGRWFGYREGYEDLVRLWMPNEVSEAFRQLAQVEHELREEIEEYALRGATPLDFAVRIRVIPGLAVTRRAVMRHAVDARIDYRGQHLQTIRFPRLDEARLRENWSAGSALVKDAEIAGPGFVGRAAAHRIARFLREYEVHPSHRDLSSDWLARYVEENAGAMPDWNVVVHDAGEKAIGQSSEPLGTFRPGTVRRSRLKGTRDDVADIKALMSRADVLADLPADNLPDGGWRTWDWSRLKKWREDHLGRRPLLILYPIDRRSPPLHDTPDSQRALMEAAFEVLGFGIVFPMMGIDAGNRPTRYISVNLAQTEYDVEGEAVEAPDNSDEDADRGPSGS